MGSASYINSPRVEDDMDIVKRPLSNIAEFSPLVYPLPSPGNWGEEKHFTWSNVDLNDSVPVCGSTYGYVDESLGFEEPFAGEIFCIQTDGRASTVWRFAHDRATYISPFFKLNLRETFQGMGAFSCSVQIGMRSLAKDQTGHPVRMSLS